MKGGSDLKVISDGLILKSSADLAFAEGSESILWEKELKVKWNGIDEIEAEWSKAQKDVV